MNLFVVGDVHGCLNTFKQLLRNWNPQEEILIQVGDLISKGKNTPQTVRFARELKNKFDDKVVFLLGNHEYNLIQYFKGNINEKWYKKSGGKELLWQYQLEEESAEKDAEWMSSWPTFWENEFVFISHAGISNSEITNDLSNSESIIFNKGKLKKINKLQIYGHRPVNNEATYESDSHSWNIDTGAVYNGKLTAIKIRPDGEILNFYSIAAIKTDIE